MKPWVGTAACGLLYSRKQLSHSSPLERVQIKSQGIFYSVTGRGGMHGLCVLSGVTLCNTVEECICLTV